MRNDGPLPSVEADPQLRTFPPDVQARILADHAATQRLVAQRTAPISLVGPVRQPAPPPLPSYPAPLMQVPPPAITPVVPNDLQSRQIPAGLQPGITNTQMLQDAGAGLWQGVHETPFGQMVLTPAEQDIAARAPQPIPVNRAFNPYGAANTPGQQLLDNANAGISLVRGMTYGPLVDAYHGAQDLAAGNAITLSTPLGFPGSNQGAVEALRRSLPGAVGETAGMLTGDPALALGGLTLKAAKMPAHPEVRPPASEPVPLSIPDQPPVAPTAAPAPTTAGGIRLALAPGLDERTKSAIKAVNDSGNSLGASHPETQRLVQAARALIAEQRAAAPVSDPPTGKPNTATPPDTIAAPPIPRPLDYATDADAINAKIWYHGTGTPDLSAERLDPNMTKIDGLFGHGIYLTDNPDIAGGYANARSKRNGTPTVYKAGVNVGRVLDLERPMPDDAVKLFSETGHGLDPEVGAAVDDAARTPGATGQDVYKAFSNALSDASHAGDIDYGAITEGMQNLSGDLKRAGYDAYTHVGGVRTGRDPHQTLIMIDPNDHLSGYVDTNNGGKWVGTGRDRQITSFGPVDFANEGRMEPAGARSGSVGTGPEPKRIIRARIANLQRQAAEATRNGDHAEIARITDAIQSLRDAHQVFENEDPAAPASPRNVDSLYNDAKYGFTTPGARDKFRQTLKAAHDRLVAEGRDPKERVPFDEVLRDAADMNPEAIDNLRDKKQALNRTEYEAARMTADSLSEDADRAEHELAHAIASHLPQDEIDVLRNRLHSIESNLEGFQAVLTASRSEKGRELAYLRRITEKGFDTAYWLARADRVSGGHLTATINRELRAIIQRGAAAQAAGDVAGVRSARIDLAKAMGKLHPGSFWDALSQTRKAGLLSSVRTIGKITISHAVHTSMEELARAAAGVGDMAYSAATGAERKNFIPTPANGGRAMITGTVQGAKDSWEIMKHGLTEEDLARLTIPRELNSKYPWLNNYVNLTFRSHSAAYRPFKIYAFQRALQDLAQLEAHKTSNWAIPPTRAQRANLAKVFLDHPTPEMIAEATAAGEFATFSEENRAASGIATLKTKQSPAGRFAIDMVMPFSHVPMNVVMHALDYACLGGLYRVARLDEGMARRAIAGALTDAEQRTIAMAFGRGMVGTPLLLLGYYLAKGGTIGPIQGATGTFDREKAQAMTLANRPFDSIKILGKWIRTDSMSPAGNLIVMGAQLAQSMDGAHGMDLSALVGHSLPEAAQNVAGVASSLGQIGLDTMMDAPYMQGVQALHDLREDHSKAKFAGSMVASFVPTALSDAASTFDTKDRQVDTSNSLSAIRDSVGLKLPLVRNQLPAKVSALGDDVANERMGVQAWNPLAGKTAAEDHDVVIHELVKHGIQVPAAAKSAKLESDQAPVPYTADEQTAFKRYAGAAMRQAAAATIGKDDYQRTSADDQKEMLVDAMKEAHRDAAAEFKDDHEADLERRQNQADTGKQQRDQRKLITLTRK